jgi:hypothetical protein
VPLHDYIGQFKRSENVKIFYGTNQSNSQRLAEIIDSEFGEGGIDVVIDDASHHYPETRASFATIFARVSPGGCYIIEDWGWAHWPSKHWSTDYFRGRPAVTNLVAEICALVAARPDIARDICVSPEFMVVRRGPAKLAAGFNVSQYFLSQGRPIRPFL